MSPTKSRTPRARWRALITSLAACAGLLAAPSCDQEDDCTRGDEGCYCTADFRCLEGLACRSFLCVDPEWTPPEPEPEPPAGDGGKPVDNVSACEQWLASLECGGESLGDQLGEALVCETFEEYACSLDGYFQCLEDNTRCDGEYPDVTGWNACAGRLSC